jgi:hypothetical protein
MKNKIIGLGIIMCIIIAMMPVSACEEIPNIIVNNTVSVQNILTQSQWMSQQQEQKQEQNQHQEINVASGTQSSWVGDESHIGGIISQSQTYSRLVYPGEVLTYEIKEGDTATLLAGLPVAFYIIGNGHGYDEDKVQTSEAQPVYDPYFHKMDFGHVPVVESIDYWTMKAKLNAPSGSAFVVIDNRAPMNDYVTVEVTVTSPESDENV